MWKCDRKIWRTQKGKLVEDGDPRAWSLVATAGMEFETKPVIEPMLESKAVEPVEDKAVKPDEDKGEIAEDKSKKKKGKK